MGMGERRSGNPLFPINLARLELGLIVTAKYVFLSVSSPPHNGGGYVNGALLNPLTEISHPLPRVPSYAVVF